MQNASPPTVISCNLLKSLIESPLGVSMGPDESVRTSEVRINTRVILPGTGVYHLQLQIKTSEADSKCTSTAEKVGCN